MNDSMPIVPMHPSEFIQEEMDARGWAVSDLANAMGMDRCVRSRLILDIYFAVGPLRTSCRLGNDTADRLAHAFDVSKDLFINLENAWLRDMKVDP